MNNKNDKSISKITFKIKGKQYYFAVKVNGITKFHTNAEVAIKFNAGGDDEQKTLKYLNRNPYIDKDTIKLIIIK